MQYKFTSTWDLTVNCVSPMELELNSTLRQIFVESRVCVPLLNILKSCFLQSIPFRLKACCVGIVTTSFHLVNQW